MRIGTLATLFVAAIPLLAGAKLAEAPSLAAGDWSVLPSTSMSTPRAAHQATFVRQSWVLLTGGCSGPGCSPIEQSAEIFDIERGRFTATGSMNEKRVSHIAAPIPGGRVLVAGGWTGAATTASAEIFDPQARAFSTAGAMATPRMDGTATPLAGGSVLIAGGATGTNRPLAEAEIFDPATGRFGAVGPMAQARSHHASVRLPDGRVLVMGGLQSRGQAMRTAEIYDPSTKAFLPAGVMQQARCKHAAVLLKDGRVMVIGGSSDCDERRRMAETEIFDPRSGLFSAGPKLLNPRYKIVGAATVLPSGEVIVAGDADDVEIWVPGTSAFIKTRGGIGKGLAFSVATPLPGGTILVTGGYDTDVRATAGTWLIRHTGSQDRQN